MLVKILILYLAYILFSNGIACASSQTIILAYSDGKPVALKEAVIINKERSVINKVVTNLSGAVVLGLSLGEYAVVVTSDGKATEREIVVGDVPKQHNIVIEDTVLEYLLKIFGYFNFIFSPLMGALMGIVVWHYQEGKKQKRAIDIFKNFTSEILAVGVRSFSDNINDRILLNREISDDIYEKEMAIVDRIAIDIKENIARILSTFGSDLLKIDPHKSLLLSQLGGTFEELRGLLYESSWLEKNEEIKKRRALLEKIDNLLAILKR